MKSSQVILVLAATALVYAQEEKEPRFSIGLGVLAPSYTQKFAGNGRLDVDQNKNGFSYSLNNVPHPSSSGSSSASSYQSQSNPEHYQSAPGSDYSSQQGQFSIYQHRSIPKQSADTSYHSPSDDEYSEPQQTSHQSQGSHGSPHQYQHQSNLEHRQYDNSASNGGQSYNGPQQPQQIYNSEPDYNSEGQDGANAQHNGPRFSAYNFEQEISHQVQEHQPFQSQSQPQMYHSQGGQSYQPQQSRPQLYQSQPTHQRVISLAQPLQSQPQLQYKPQTIYSLRV